MNAFDAYASDSSESSASPAQAGPLSAAPPIPSAAPPVRRHANEASEPSSHQAQSQAIAHDPEAARARATARHLGTAPGQLSTTAMETWQFNAQHRAAQRREPGTSSAAGALQADLARRGANTKPSASKARVVALLASAETGRADGPFMAMTDITKQPSAADRGELTASQREARAAAARKAGAEAEEAPTEEDAAADAPVAAVDAVGIAKADAPEQASSANAWDTSKCRAQFHGSSRTDWQGRSWIAPPAGVRPVEDYSSWTSALPKKVVGGFKGHKGGVASMQLWQGTGHLLLSGGLDCVVKVWDVATRSARQSYFGHAAGVRCVDWTAHGEHIVSASHDRSVKVWDTESGRALLSLDTEGSPVCVATHPVDPSCVLVGYSNAVVKQWDARSGEVVQSYEYHTGSVQSLAYVENGLRFVSSSLDRRMLVWDANIPVPVLYLSDPGMPSMPSLQLTPSGNFILAQGMDNALHVWHAKDRVREHPRKQFTGHNVSGFACRPYASPDGRKVISGDGDGTLWVWDWKSCRVLRQIPVHAGGPCITALWHPLEPSTVITGGWDGAIRVVQ